MNSKKGRVTKEKDALPPFLLPNPKHAESISATISVYHQYILQFQVHCLFSHFNFEVTDFIIAFEFDSLIPCYIFFFFDFSVVLFEKLSTNKRKIKVE